jgi:fido (protein-threonine AMPylation protein)
MPNYTLADGETVKNKLGAKSHAELESVEVDFVKIRQLEHLAAPTIPRTFDAAHLKAIQEVKWNALRPTAISEGH